MTDALGRIDAGPNNHCPGCVEPQEGDGLTRVRDEVVRFRLRGWSTADAGYRYVFFDNNGDTFTAKASPTP